VINEHWLIPLTPQAQSFGIVLSGAEYRLTVRWFDAVEGGWHLDIQEPDNTAPLLLGLPLVGGCDLLRPFVYQQYGGGLRISGEHPATSENLGTAVRLVFGDAEDFFGDLLAEQEERKRLRDVELVAAYAAHGRRMADLLGDV
jgi:hypothetical protein